MEKISLTVRVRNEVLHGVKEERNIIHTVKRRKATWIGHILRRNSYKTHYCRKDRRRDRSDAKTRKNVSSYWMTLRNRQRKY